MSNGVTLYNKYSWLNDIWTNTYFNLSIEHLKWIHKWYTQLTFLELLNKNVSENCITIWWLVCNFVCFIQTCLSLRPPVLWRISSPLTLWFCPGLGRLTMVAVLWRDTWWRFVKAQVRLTSGESSQPSARAPRSGWPQDSSLKENTASGSGPITLWESVNPVKSPNQSGWTTQVRLFYFFLKCNKRFDETIVHPKI